MKKYNEKRRIAKLTWLPVTRYFLESTLQRPFQYLKTNISHKNLTAWR